MRQGTLAGGRGPAGFELGRGQRAVGQRGAGSRPGCPKGGTRAMPASWGEVAVWQVHAQPCCASLTLTYCACTTCRCTQEV